MLSSSYRQVGAILVLARFLSWKPGRFVSRAQTPISSMIPRRNRVVVGVPFRSDHVSSGR